MVFNLNLNNPSWREATVLALEALRTPVAPSNGNDDDTSQACYHGGGTYSLLPFCDDLRDLVLKTEPQIIERVLELLNEWNRTTPSIPQTLIGL